MGGLLMKFKLYLSKTEYTKRLNIFNKEMGFQSNKGTRLVNGQWKELNFSKVMTRTWADENPRITLQSKYPLPIEGKTTLTGLVDYDKNWYPIEEIEPKVIK